MFSFEIFMHVCNVLWSYRPLFPTHLPQDPSQHILLPTSCSLLYYYFHISYRIQLELSHMHKYGTIHWSTGNPPVATTSKTNHSSFCIHHQLLCSFSTRGGANPFSTLDLAWLPSNPSCCEFFSG